MANSILDVNLRHTLTVHVYIKRRIMFKMLSFHDLIIRKYNIIFQNWITY